MNKPSKKAIITILKESRIPVGDYGSAVAKVAYGPNKQLLIWQGNSASFEKITQALLNNNIDYQVGRFSDFGGLQGAGDDTQVLKINQLAKQY